jgi:anti-sigma regulatory factor (Ser/Thr protein kinase)
MSPQRRFANDATSVREARRFVLDAVDDLSPAAADAIAVMVSELAANAVRHTGSHFTVAVDRSPDQIRVDVGDSGPGDPVVRAPEPAELSGRGLQIVRALAAEWGVIPAVGTQGKTVWFTFAVETSPDQPPAIARRLAEPARPREARAGDGSASPSTRGSRGAPANRIRVRPSGLRPGPDRKAHERHAASNSLRARLRRARCSPLKRAASSPATNAPCG